MSDADEKICASKIIIYDWVEKVENDAVLYDQRKATEIVLNAIAMTETLSKHLFLKGGILMALKYKSPRNTGDIDFTIDLDAHNDITTTLRDEIDVELPRAVVETGYVGFHLRVQAIKILPKKSSLEEDTYPAIKVKVGYVIDDNTNGTTFERQRERLKKGTAPNVITIDISFNEEISGHQAIMLENENSIIKAYSINDLIGEKIRALLQQPEKKKKRRQDIFDISLLIDELSFDHEAKENILNSIKRKCNSRGITADQNSLSSENIRTLSGKEWDTIGQEIGLSNLPDFESCYSKVEKFYKSLPW